MTTKKEISKKPHPKLRQLNFLIGKWHTEGEIYQTASSPSMTIKGMDTYEWINNGFFMLHRVDVFMGDARIEVMEIIGYDDVRKSFFMKSFDQEGEMSTMYATVEKPGTMLITDKKMRATLTAAKNKKTMKAKWEQSANGKKWIPWMEVLLTK